MGLEFDTCALDIPQDTLPSVFWSSRHTFDSFWQLFASIERSLKENAHIEVCGLHVLVKLAANQEWNKMVKLRVVEVKLSAWLDTVGKVSFKGIPPYLSLSMHFSPQVWTQVCSSHSIVNILQVSTRQRHNMLLYISLYYLWFLYSIFHVAIFD